MKMIFSGLMLAGLAAIAYNYRNEIMTGMNQMKSKDMGDKAQAPVPTFMTKPSAQPVSKSTYSPAYSKKSA